MSRSRFPFALSLCLIAWLFTTGTAVAEMDVNATFIPPGPTISGQSYDSTPATDAPAGTFSFTSTYCNSNGDSNNGTDPLPGYLESRTVTLTNGNVLLNRNMTTSTAAGVGSRLYFLLLGDYADQSLALNECVAVEYRIGLQTSDRFQFYVDLWLDRPVTLLLSAPTLVTENHPVHLSAVMAPLDPGDVPTFAWVQTSGPTVTLTDANTASPSFIAPKKIDTKSPPTLVFEVTASLNGKSQVQQVAIDVITGDITVDAGQQRSVNIGSSVSLHGSSVPHASVKWKWEQTQGDPVILTNGDTANPSFTAPATTQTLEFKASAWHGSKSGQERVSVIVVRQTAMTVTSSGDLNVVSGDTVTLNCTLNGGTPTIEGWVQYSGTPSVTLSGADTLTATFTAPAVTSDASLVFKCSATGPDGNPEDLLTVTVSPPTTPLTINAGSDQDVYEDDTVALHGAGSGGNGALTYAWIETITSTGVTLIDATTQNPSFKAPILSNDTPVPVTLKVTVTDSSSPTPVTKSDIITYTVQNRHVRVDAGVGAQVAPGANVHLQAHVQGGLPPYTYLWSQTAGTTVTLSDTSAANPEFTAPSVTADETLTFKVHATDSLNNIATDATNNTPDDSVNVDVNVPQVAAVPLAVSVSAPKAVNIKATVSVTGTVSGGTKPTNYVYAWTANNSDVVFTDATARSTTYKQPTANNGDHRVVTLTVTNGSDTPESADATIVIGHFIIAEVCNGPPIICEQRYREKLCNDGDKTFAINYLRNHADGSRTLERSCGTKVECQNDWWVTTSDQDVCQNFNPDALMTYAFECTYCCTRDRCNLPIRPVDDSMFIGISSETDPSDPSLPLIPLEEGAADSSTPQDGEPGAAASRRANPGASMKRP